MKSILELIYAAAVIGALAASAAGFFIIFLG